MVSNSRRSIRSRTYGHSITISPSSLSTVPSPSTKPLVSATWASTLLAMTRSASLPWPRSSRADLSVKKSHIVSTPAARAALAGPGARVDAEHRDPGLHEVPQHVAVVGGDLDHQARTAQAQPIDQLQRVGPRVLQQRGGERGIVRIIAAENLLRRNRLEDLRQAAVRTEGHLQGEFLLLGLELVAGHQPIRQGHVAQVQHGQQAGLAAGAATGGITLVSERVWVLHSKSFKKRKANSPSE